ncbi:MAG: TlpA family protein disulfide reductase [Ardenticatenaceae bacterium]
MLDSDGGASRAFGVKGMPATFFIDHAGRIQDMIVGGPMTGTYLRSRLELGQACV